MIIAGVPYWEQRLAAMNEISGGTPYRASTDTAAGGSRLPSENELAIPASRAGTLRRSRSGSRGALEYEGSGSHFYGSPEMTRL